MQRTLAEEQSGKVVTTADGRNIDPGAGTLGGEGSHMRVQRPDQARDVGLRRTRRESHS